MSNIKIISFDLEGTLVTPDFSHAVWHEDIPRLYAEKHGFSYDRAKVLIEAEYDCLGDSKKEWYDIKYWFKKFELGDYQQVLTGKRRARRYPEVDDVLQTLKQTYPLIITSASAREFMPHLLKGIEKHFERIFSSISDYGLLKAPEFYLRVCREVGVRPDQMVHIGDSWQFDYVAASEAGIRAYHINRDAGENSNGSLTSLAGLLNKLPIKNNSFS